MKKVNFILASVVFISTNIFALNIDEAVKIGLENSHRLKGSTLNQNVADELYKKAQSGYKPTIDLSYSLSDTTQNNPDSDSTPGLASISLGYNLFNGFKDKYAIEGAKEGFKTSIYQKDALEADLKLEIQLAYIDFLEKRKTLSTKKEAVELVEKTLKDTTAYYNQGLLAKNSLLETKVSLSKTVQDKLIAKSELLIAREVLNRLLGGNILPNEDIEEIEFELKDVAGVKELIKTGLQNRSEIKAMNSTIKETISAYNASKSDLYPKVDVKLSHTQADDYMYDDQSIASLNISYNLYQGGANEANRAVSMYKTRIAQEKLETLKLDTILQIERAKEAYNLSLENRKVTKDGKEFAEENFSIMENRYKSQLEKTTDFLNARLSLSEARIAHIKSLYYIYSQHAKLLRVTQE